MLGGLHAGVLNASSTAAMDLVKSLKPFICNICLNNFRRCYSLKLFKKRSKCRGK